jgi:O-methyltransferase involved in polyketide biosynthesis
VAAAPVWQDLEPVARTLLIPLRARALGGALFAPLDPHDVQALQVLQACGEQALSPLQDVPTVLNVLWRTRRIRQIGEDFFARHPDALGIQLGAGLSNPFQWFDNGRNRWLDADLASVVQLRRRLLPPQQRRREVALDLSIPGWWQRLCLPSGPDRRPVLLVCEGVLMYLHADQVQALLREVGENAPAGSELVFDFISPLGVGLAAWHPSVGPTGAQFHWGWCDAQGLPGRPARLHGKACFCVCEAYGPAGLWAQWWLGRWGQGPLYGLAHLEVRGP